MNLKRFNMQNPKIENYVDKMEITFKLLFLLYTMLSFNNLTYGHKVISFVMWPMILMGGLLLLYRIWNWKKYIRMPLFPILIAFALSFVISMLVNLNYGLKQNIITLIFLCFYFFLLFTHENSTNIQKVKKEFNIIVIFFVAYMTICVIISLMMLLRNFGHVTVLSDGYEVVSGFMWGRLFGVFLEPNPASIMAIMVILILLYWMQEKKKTIINIIGGIVIILQVLFIVFSDSRTAQVCLMIISFLAVLMKAYENKEKYSTWKKKVFIIVLALLVSIGCTLIINGVKNTYNSITKYYATVTDKSDDQEEDAKLIERAYNLHADPSNRRFDIWKSGLEIFNENKIFGTSYYGIQPYAKEYLPETYIINNTQTDFRNLHNEFLNILVSQGIIGAIIVCFLVVFALKKIFEGYFVATKEYLPIINMLLLSIISITISVMFVAAGMFYYNIASTNMFWIFLGYLLVILDKCKIDFKKGECRND